MTSVTLAPSEAGICILVNGQFRISSWIPADKSRTRTVIPERTLLQVAGFGSTVDAWRTADVGTLGCTDCVWLDSWARSLAVIEGALDDVSSASLSFVTAIGIGVEQLAKSSRKNLLCERNQPSQVAQDPATTSNK
jgi:hypothetical protein